MWDLTLMLWRQNLTLHAADGYWNKRAGAQRASISATVDWIYGNACFACVMNAICIVFRPQEKPVRFFLIIIITTLVKRIIDSASVCNNKSINSDVLTRVRCTIAPFCTLHISIELAVFAPPHVTWCFVATVYGDDMFLSSCAESFQFNNIHHVQRCNRPHRGGAARRRGTELRVTQSVKGSSSSLSFDFLSRPETKPAWQMGIETTLANRNACSWRVSSCHQLPGRNWIFCN